MGISQEVTAYRQTSVETASPIELVIMLCDTLVRDLKQVIASIRARDIEARVQHSNRAFSVLNELDLMLDFENGGETANELARVYSHVRAKLMESQLKLDPTILERQIEFISQIRKAWQEALNTATASRAAIEIPSNIQDTPFPYGSVSDEARICNWSA